MPDHTLREFTQDLAVLHGYVEAIFTTPRPLQSIPDDWVYLQTVEALFIEPDVVCLLMDDQPDRAAQLLAEWRAA